MKKVSVIVPVYNVERYLEECLDSLKNQTYTNLEIILIDDGSTDGSGSICDNYASQDNRFKVVHQINQGAACAKNRGLDVFTGDYFTFLDSDDYVECDWIESMYNVMNEHDCDIVECSFVKKYINREEKVYSLEKEQQKIFDTSEYLKFYIDHWHSSLLWNKLFKRELTKDIRFKNERRCIDDEFYTYKLCSNAKKVVLIDKVLYHYRQRKSSAVFSDKNEYQRTIDALDVLVERFKWIKEKHKYIAKYYYNHDVDILNYFINSFLFNEEAEEKLRKVVIYYLRNLFICGLNVQNCYLIFVYIYKVFVKKAYKNNIKHKNIDLENYYM